MHCMWKIVMWRHLNNVIPPIQILTYSFLHFQLHIISSFEYTHRFSPNRQNYSQVTFFVALQMQFSIL